MYHRQSFCFQSGSSRVTLPFFWCWLDASQPMINPSLLSSSDSIVEVSSSAPAAQEPALKPGEYPFKRGQLRVPSSFFCVFFYTCKIFSSHLNCSLHCSTCPQDPQSKPEEKCELPSTCRYSKETSIGFMNFFFNLCWTASQSCLEKLT